MDLRDFVGATAPAHPGTAFTDPRASGPEVSASRPWTPDPETTPATCSTRPCNPFLALGSARAPSPPILSRADSYTPGPQQPVSEALSPSEAPVSEGVETPPTRTPAPPPPRVACYATGPGRSGDSSSKTTQAPQHERPDARSAFPLPLSPKYAVPTLIGDVGCYPSDQVGLAFLTARP